MTIIVIPGNGNSINLHIQNYQKRKKIRVKSKWKKFHLLFKIIKWIFTLILFIFNLYH